MTPGSTDSHLLVLAAGQRWAVPAAAVAEVVATLTVTRAPGLPGWLTGLATHRDRLLPVADLGLLMGSDIRAMGPVFVLELAGGDLGLAFAETAGTLDLASGEMMPLPAGVPVSEARLLAGAVRVEGELVAVLDIDAFAALRAALPPLSGPSSGG